MEFTNNIYSSNPPPVKKLHSFLLSEVGTQSRKVKYWGFSKDEAYLKARTMHPEKNILWIKELV
jgi:hypothetical protein